MRRWVIVGVVVAVIVAAAIAVLVDRRSQERTAFEDAVRMVPTSSERYVWTDWAQVRTTTKATSMRQLLGRGFDEDLTSTSALTDVAGLLDQKFGWSPYTAIWELLAQSPEGAVDVVRLADSVSFDALTSAAEGLGFEEKDGVWAGGEELLAQIAPEQSNPTLENLAFVPDRHLVLLSDSATYLGSVLDGLDGQDSAVDPVVSALAATEPTSAVAYTAAYVCKSLAMASADDQAQAQAKELIAAAGRVDPLTGYAMGRDGDDGDLTVAMSFASADQARRNATSRAVLAAGPAPGQGGSFTDRFTLGRVEAKDDLVTMTLRPAPDSYVLSDLSSGPVLFATC